MLGLPWKCRGEVCVREGPLSPPVSVPACVCLGAQKKYFVCLAILLAVCLSASQPSAYLSMYLSDPYNHAISVCLFIHPSRYLSVHLSILQSIHLSIQLQTHTHVRPSIHPYICPSIYLSTHPSIHPSINLSSLPSFLD